MAWLKKNRKKTEDLSGGPEVSTSSDTNLGASRSGGNNPKLITLNTVREKVNQLLIEFGVEAIEQSCKWFLLWNNR